MKNKNQFCDLEHLQLVARRIAESGIDITDVYADWIDVTFACASLGEAARESYHTICRNSQKYKREDCDEKFDNCLHTGRGDITLGTLFKLAKDHGIDTSMPRGRRPKTEAQRKEEQKNLFESIHRWLDAHCEFRFNTISEKVEVRMKNEDTEWHDLDERQFKSLVTELHSNNVKVGQTNLEAYLGSEMIAPAFNPIITYASSLAPWKPSHKDYITDMFCHLGLVEDEYREFRLWMAKKWYVWLIAVAIEQDTVNQIMLILAGENMGVGKTFFVESFLPLPIRRYIHRMVELSRFKDKDELLALARNILCFLDEIQLTPTTLNKLKNYVGGAAATAITERSQYAHFATMRKVHTSWIATTNQEVFLPESTGDRRFVVLPVTQRGRNYKSLPLERAFAQGYYLATHPKHFKLEITPEEIQKLQEINQRYVQQDLCTAMIPTVLRHPGTAEQAQAVTTGDIISWLTSRTGPNREFTPQKIGVAMKNNGFVPVRTSKGMRYMVVRIMMDELERENKLLANQALIPELPF